MASQATVLTLGGRKIACLDSGGEGPLMVLVHGFGADRSSFSLTMPIWSQTHRVVAVDLPGHGGSPAIPGTFDFLDLAEIVIQVADYYSPQPVHLVGHSLGGGACVSAASEMVGRVAKLSLIAPFGIGAVFDKSFAERFCDMNDEGEALGVLRLLVARPNLVSSRMANSVLDHLSSPGVRAFLMRLATNTLINKSDCPNKLVAEFDELQVPKQLIWGDQDTILTPDFNHSRFASAVKIAGAGHMPHLEQAALVAKAVVAFANS